MIALHNPTGDSLDLLARRARWLAVPGALALLLVLGSYWYIQVVRGPFYRGLAENNRLRRATIQAPRGLITDCHGRLLVENVPSYNLLFDRSLADDRQQSLQFAAAALGSAERELEQVLVAYRGTPDFQPVLIAEDLTLSQTARFEVAALEHPEFHIRVLQRRLYRHGPQTAHLLGYLGEIARGELDERGLAAGDLVGREGIESACDTRLRGKDGEREAVVDSRGKLIDEYRRQPARPGEQLRLTIDLELQKTAAHQMEGKVGAVVALDPRDGAIRALISMPSYDPNLFVKRLQKKEWAEILGSPHHPLQNRAVQNTYAPGSVFKLVMGVAALSEHAVDLRRRVFCSGQVKLHGRVRRCWLSGGHGFVNLHEATRQSCDVYFYVLGSELGIETIARYARRFGLGSATGVGLPGERAGIVPDSAWSLQVRNSPWYPGETVSVSIGQGPILTSPLQVAIMMAVAANRGKRVVPYLVEGEAQPAVDLGLDPAALETVREALRAVVNDRGTGASARLAGIEIAGKTGTSQVIEQKTWIRNEDLPYEQRDHAWFASFGPYESPELVVVAFVEHGGHGSRVAAPVARALYAKYFELERRQ